MYFLFVRFKNLLYLCTVFELGRHIEILLLDNDCVIIPDFGGFVAHQVSARYDEQDNLWLPPMRTLGFNPQLRINDSLLVQSYVNAYDISYPEALRRIEDEVASLKQELEENGVYNIDNIGKLTVNAEGNYYFEPCEAGILSPYFYGLGCCGFMTLQDSRDKASATPPQALLEFTDNEADEEAEDRAIQIKMSWIRNTIAIAAAIIAFFIMATPIANSDLRTRTMSHLQNNLLYKLIPQDTNMAPATPVVDTIAPPTKHTAQATIKTVTAHEQNIPQTEHPYCIVLASQVKMSNAEEYVEQLKRRGYEEAEVYVHNKIVRVVYGAYETESEAYRQLNKLNRQEEFYEAWVYKKTQKSPVES